MQKIRRQKRLTYIILALALSVLPVVSSFAQSVRQKVGEKMNHAADVVYENPDFAIRLSNEAVDIARINDDVCATSMALSGFGYISYEVGDFRASLLNYMKALDVLRKADTTDLSNEVIILNELSRIQSEFNNHNESIRYGEQAWDLAKEYVRNNPIHARETAQAYWLVDIPYYLAIEYSAKGAHQTAGKILLELWEEAEDKNDIVAYSQVLNELGIIKMNNGEYSAAQEFLGLVVSIPEVDLWDRSIAYHNLAGTYMEQGDLDKAESYFLIALDLKLELEDPESVFITYLDLGELEFKRNNGLKAIEYWEAALKAHENVDTNPELYSVYNWLQLAYMDVDIEKAKIFNQKYTDLNNFYVKNQTVQRELEAQNRQELNTWIDQQRQDRVDAEQRQQFLQQFWPVILGVALLVIFSLILGVRYYWAMRTNRVLKQARLREVEA